MQTQQLDYQYAYYSQITDDSETSQSMSALEQDTGPFFNQKKIENIPLFCLAGTFPPPLCQGELPSDSHPSAL